MTKKLLSFLIASAMLLSLIPAAALAKSASAPSRDAESLLWDFSTDPAADGWTFVDEDGDGYNWDWVEDTASGAPIASSETHTLRSFSYYSGAGALHPDNWAITPEVTIDEGAEATLSYQIASYSGSFTETYRIYVFAEGSEEPVAVTDDLTSPATIRIFEERTVDLSDYAGQSVKVAFRHYNSYNQFRVFLDDVAISGASQQDDPVTPPVARDLILGCYFEEGHDPAEEGWQFIDADEDGKNWQWKPSTFGVAYEGTGIISSYSYVYPPGNVNPDNWAISPAVQLPDSGLSATFYAKGYLADYCAEHFAVYVGSTDSIEDMTEIIPETVTTGTWTQYTADLSDYANETVYIAIRHFNTNPGEEALCIDQFEVWGSSGAAPTEPPVDPTEPPVDPTEPPVDNTVKIVGYYFETDPELDGWQYVDVDGDNYNWFWNGESTYYAYEGYGSIMSASYQNGTALDPDNWAISPAIELLAENLSVTFYAKASSSSYTQEHFAVYAGTTDSIEEMSEIMAETVATATYTQYTADLSDFANETVYIAIRHFNCHDQMRFLVDQFEVWGEEGEVVDPTEPPVDPTDPPVDPSEPPQPVLIENIEILGFVEPAWGEAPFLEVSVPDDANYSLSYTDWQWWNSSTYDGEVMGPNEVFNSEQNAYYQYFEIVPDEGYVFSSATTVTINGSDGMIETKGWMPNSGYFWAYTIDFFVTEPEDETLLGDVDGDGDVDTTDALLALRYVLGLVELSEEQLAQADVNGDGEVAMVDCLLVHRKAMGLIESFPAEQP